MTEYVVLADHLILDPVDDTSGPRRHRRGEVVDLEGLDPNEVKHLKSQGAVASKSAAAAKAAAAEPPPVPDLVIENPPVIEPGGAASLVGAGVASGLVVDPADSAALVTESGVPAKSATEDVWRAYAIAAGVLTEAEAAGLSKAQLQKAVAAKAG